MKPIKNKVASKKNISKKEKKSSKKTSVKSAKKEVQEPILMQPPRGMRDILPNEQEYWNRVRMVLDKEYPKYGFGRIDIPSVEYANLFIRSIGTGTDLIDKEIYTFVTKGKDRVALRPEMTAGIARAYIQHGMNVLSKPIKLFSIGPVYRYDRPQEGRYREHFQANFDIFGEEDSVLDAQIMQLAYRILGALGLKSIQFQINSIGCPDCRKEYIDMLVSYFDSKKKKLCKTCKARLRTNPLRILDCKEDKCVQVSANAPQTVDHLCNGCRDHFKSLLEYLDELELPYAINPQLVRGLDYYTRTVFEIWSADEDGKKKSLGGGGRYDKLIESLGGEPTPAIGFALGIDRLVLEMKRVKAKSYESPKPRIFIAQLGNLAKKKSLKLFSDLEREGILIAESFGRGSLKSQLRTANRIGVEMTIIIGQKEALDETVIIKNMVTGTQETIPQEKVLNAVKKILKSKPMIIKKKKSI
ncbi:MAG: Histidine-tRNA ligase [Candidatus Moranbacteria bacterium GW2011_GWE2_35_164]|nr:MAG: Histidine-tRNA ligase [Candidatus Moranbacteria bacterium GW2011_GWE2_35_164]